MAASNFDSLGINNFKQKSLLSGDDSWPSQKICSTPSQSRNTVTFQAFFKRDKIIFYICLLFLFCTRTAQFLCILYIIIVYTIWQDVGIRTRHKCNWELLSLSYAPYPFGHLYLEHWYSSDYVLDAFTQAQNVFATHS